MDGNRNAFSYLWEIMKKTTFLGMKCWVITNQRSVAEPVLPACPCEKKTVRKGFFFALMNLK